MIASDLSGPQAFKYLCKIVDSGGKYQLLENIMDSNLRDFISRAIEENVEKRPTIQDLLGHPFL